jgi:hypothetical protein
VKDEVAVDFIRGACGGERINQSIISSWSVVVVVRKNLLKAYYHTVKRVDFTYTSMTHDFSIEASSRFTSTNYEYRGSQCDDTKCEPIDRKSQSKNKKSKDLLRCVEAITMV